ncbi:MAG: hypothetical protein BRD47_05115 [Bacteroidetes bacterium QS_8_68_28]|nr:MAG: hypothetical protein BRD47_05115 [Bacteroidetes bacterium QS_8_68_28]
MKKRLQDKFEELAAESPVLMVFLVFLFTAALVVPVSLPFFFSPAVKELKVNLVAESYGILLDLLILGWLLLWLSSVADRRERKNRYREEIEDALGWRSPVASHRIVSNVRRLNRSGVTEGLELPEAHLKGASLENVRLNNSNLWGANLEEATLRRAELAGSLLAGAALEAADLESARLEAADLRGANLRTTDMERAHAEKADLRGADLEEADLQYATLRGIELERANLSGANLRAAALEEANLGRATLREANLTGARLAGTRLDKADLTGATLRKADLRGTSLDGAILRAADLSGVRLAEEDTDALGQAATLYEAALDDALREHLQGAHPHLFEAPGDGGESRSQAGTIETSAPGGGDGAATVPSAGRNVASQST